MKCSITGQEKGDLLIQVTVTACDCLTEVTTWADLTVYM